jgi:triosephosphate isomerase (TIM)
MATRRKLAAGNWKMNGLAASLSELNALAAGLAGLGGADVLICPPATLIERAAKLGVVPIGAQDCHAQVSGAHTGDLSALMLKEVGAVTVIVGHSERRADHGETSKQVRAKAQAALAAGMSVIICVGETEAQRDAGQTQAVVLEQLAQSVPDAATAATCVIAYEPVWAIGTGRTPTAADVANVHAAIRGALVSRFGEHGDAMRILYGGSVKASNAAELMAVPNVDGALVGGASLKAADFLPIVAACQ